MKEKSELIRGTSKCARFFICDTTEIVKEAKSIHNLDPVATMLFGKLLTVTAIMGKDLKGDNDLLTLKINGDGPYGNMLATGNKKGEVKGYIGTVENEKLNSIVNEKGEFITDEKGHVKFIGNGTLQVIKDMGLKEPFVGLTHLAGEDIADGNVEKAGGYIIQLLPGVEDSFIDKLEDKLRQIKSITELLSGGFTSEKIAELLYEDISIVEDEAEISGAHVKKYVEDYEILEKSALEYKCNCTKEKFYKGIMTLGKKEINHILEEEGKIEVECHFCGKKYTFEEKDFKDM